MNRRDTKEGRYTYSRRERLRHSEAFRRVYDEGLRVRTGDIIVYARPNEAGFSRAGVVAGRRFGKAVRRNRAKRLLREAFRLNKHRLALPCDLVLIASPRWTDLRLAHVEPHFRQLIDEINSRLAD